MRSKVALIILVVFGLQFFSGSGQVRGQAIEVNGNTHNSYLPLVIGPVISGLTATYRSGQTYITWNERTDLQGETYRIYRSGQAITSANLSSATLLATVGKNSARFYTNRFNERDSNYWKPRYVDRLIITNAGAQVPEGKGLLVWTLSAADFNGGSSGSGYYAVSVIPAGGSETLGSGNTIGPVSETVADPLPVEITNSSLAQAIGEGGHIYIQYMDLRNWNATFHAPNLANRYYGFSPTDPGISNALQYAYDYAVFTPTVGMCGGSLPGKLPVILYLNGFTDFNYVTRSSYPNPASNCAYEIYPVDVSDTWYFGFAQHHDYRQPGEVAAGDTIVNYTEQRVLRMVYDLMRTPPGPGVDSERIYVEGQSMGGSGTLAFTQRYPNVFAAGYSSQPMTNYLTAGVTNNTDWLANTTVKWGKPALNLPISISAPNGWANSLAQKYNGVGVWTWQNYQENINPLTLKTRLGDDMAPVAIIHGTIDSVINWNTQGKPTHTDYNKGLRAFSGMWTVNDHQWMEHVGLPPAMGLVANAAGIMEPYWNFGMIRDETVPALSNLSGNSSFSTVPGGYNQTIKWSSSWDSWDGKPIDTTTKWQISLCSVGFESTTLTCSGSDQTVDVTPRRIQHFTVTKGAQYDWYNYKLSGGSPIASGTVTADSNGLITIPKFKVTAAGDRLLIQPHK